MQKSPFLLALIGVVVGFYASSAEAQSTDVHTHVNLVERDKQAIDSELTDLEAHMSNAASAMDATLNGKREALEASFEAARLALELAIGNAYLARDDAERFQEWAEGRLSDTQLAQSQTTAEANALYSYANSAEQAATDTELDRSGEIGLLQGAVSSSRSSANQAATAAVSASNAASGAANRSADALAWRNRAQTAYSNATNDASLATTAKNAAEAARTAAQQASNAAQQARDSAQNLVGSAAALRALLIDRANQAATDATKIANDVQAASNHYSAVASLLNTVNAQHSSYLARLVWAEQNIPDTCIISQPFHYSHQNIYYFTAKPKPGPDARYIGNVYTDVNFGHADQTVQGFTRGTTSVSWHGGAPGCQFEFNGGRIGSLANDNINLWSVISCPYPNLFHKAFVDSTHLPEISAQSLQQVTYNGRTYYIALFPGASSWIHRWGTWGSDSSWFRYE